DMIYRRPNGDWVLVDYKTNHLKPQGERDFLAHYGRQMDLYAMALSKLFDIEVAESVFYLAEEHRFLPY
ncbi:MAG: PD-(D/E)XK nuclease family protein, partial [Bacillota bacterium]|nr:PD-(D/E)XK nuclease family protein [Bacillota bacterium]